MKRHSLIAFTLILCLAQVSISLGQKNEDDCGRKLNEAQKMYDEGKLELVPGLIEPCLNSLDKERKGIAYQLLIKSHLFNEQSTKADKAIDRKSVV